MRWISHLSVRTKLTLLVGICLAGFIVYCWLAVATVNVVKVNGPVYAAIVQGKDLLADILPPPVYLAGAVHTVTMAIADGDRAAVTREYNRFKAFKRDFETRTAVWTETLPEGPAREVLTRKVIPPAVEWYRIAEEQVWPLLLADNFRNANRIQMTELRPRFLKHAQGIEELVPLLHRINAEHEARAQQILGDRVVLLLAVAGGVIGLVLLVAVRFLSDILRPLRGLLATMQAVAARWDLTVRAPVISGDEIGQTCAAFNQVLERVQADLTRVVGVAVSLATAAEKLSANTRELSRGADEQTQQAAQTGTGVEELSTTIAQLAQHAQQIAAQARSATESAGAGHAIMAQTVTAMAQLGDTIARSAELVQELGRRSEQIGRIVKIIEEIADQTNLLALNAAIEAARAGDQGRGFAVVADEVRKLAERTTAATREIAETIHTIQADTGHAVAAMLQATKETQGGSELTKTAGQRLDAIVQAVQSMTEMIQTMAAAVEEQAAASHQIAGTVDAVAQVTRRGQAHLGEIDQAAGELAKTATALRQMVGTFTLT